MSMFNTGMGQALPPGFVSQPFDCPAGSDFAKSQEVGMCVAGDYSPMYSQAGPGSPRTYYDLTGAVAGMDMPPVAARTLIPGISNTYIYAALGVVAVMLLARRRR